MLGPDRQEKEPPWEGRLWGLPRSQGQERTVSLLEPKVREERWESALSLWALITFSVKWLAEAVFLGVLSWWTDSSDTTLCAQRPPLQPAPPTELGSSTLVPFESLSRRSFASQWGGIVL